MSRLFHLILATALLTAGIRRTEAAPTRSAVRIQVFPGHSPSGDRTILQAALDSLKALGGGTLALAAGLYRIENVQNAIVCDSCRNISVVGTGASTVLRAEPGTDGADAFFLFRHAAGITFRNLRMEGLPLPMEAWETNQEYHGGIRFAESLDIRIDRCSFRGFFTGAIIFQAGTRGFSVTDCRFDTVSYRLKGDYGAISIETGSGRGSVLRNRFAGTTHSAISAYNSDSLEILRNRADFDLRSAYTMGVFAPQGLSRSIISRNRFTGVANEGVVLNSGEKGVIGNRIERNVLNGRFAGVAINDGRFGCDQDAALDNVIYGNEITGVGTDSVQHAILLNHAARTVVHGNSIRRCHRAVSIQNCSSDTQTIRNSIQ
ncbi:MAG: right-handed parallel beta-helix repeat-containing protein [Fibrobacterota bacterium]|nr:right-handed parallel beta-helix repeat-containing protein [Fibrobacterota bacterium]